VSGNDPIGLTRA